MRHDTSRAAGRPSPSRSMRPTSKSPTAAETRDFFSSLLEVQKWVHPRGAAATDGRPKSDVIRGTSCRPFVKRQLLSVGTARGAARPRAAGAQGYCRNRLAAQWALSGKGSGSAKPYATFE